MPKISSSDFQTITKSVGNAAVCIYSLGKPHGLATTADHVQEIDATAKSMRYLVKSIDDSSYGGFLSNDAGLSLFMRCCRVGKSSLVLYWFETDDFFGMVEPETPIAAAIISPGLVAEENVDQLKAANEQWLQKWGVGHLAAEITNRITDHKSAIGILINLETEHSTEWAVHNSFLTIFLAQLQNLSSSSPLPPELSAQAWLD